MESQRLLVIEFISIRNEEDVLQNIELSWLDELYSGEFDDVSKCNLYSTEACAPLLPKLKGREANKLKLQAEHQPQLDEDVLQVMSPSEFLYNLVYRFHNKSPTSNIMWHLR